MKILDCTLRDGGYYTNWDFSCSLVEQYLKAMECLPIDYVELGYRNKPLKEYYGEYYYLPEFVLQFCKQCNPTTKFSIMLNAKDVSAEMIDDLLHPCIPYVSLIRIAVNPSEMDKALDLAKQIKKLGFEIGFNIMYMSTWTNLNNFWNKIQATSGWVDYVWLVDSFGSVFPEEVKAIVTTIRQKTDAKLGFHGHNNLELAFTNSLTALDNGCEIVDTTLIGMGRGAGNLKTELLMTYLAKIGEKIAFNDLTSIVGVFENLLKKYEWGTNLPYMISGMNSLPQKDIMEWMSKKRYSVSNIVHTLQYKTDNYSDEVRLPHLTIVQPKSNFLIIGGGESIPDHIKALMQFIQKYKDTIVIFTSAKHISLFNYMQDDWLRYFCLIGNEGNRITKNINYIHTNDVFILPPYPQKMATYVPEKIKDQSFEFLQYQMPCSYDDSPLQLALEIVLLHEKIDNIYLAGFDGYNNIFISDQYDLMKENQEIINEFSKTNHLLQSLTPTKYDHLEKSSIYSLL